MFMGVNAEHLSTRLRSLKASLFDLAAPSGSDAQVHFCRLFGKYREVQDHPFMVVIYGPHLTHGIHSYVIINAGLFLPKLSRLSRTLKLRSMNSTMFAW